MADQRQQAADQGLPHRQVLRPAGHLAHDDRELAQAEVLAAELGARREARADPASAQAFQLGVDLLRPFSRTSVTTERISSTSDTS